MMTEHQILTDAGYGDSIKMNRNTAIQGRIEWRGWSDDGQAGMSIDNNGVQIELDNLGRRAEPGENDRILRECKNRRDAMIGPFRTIIASQGLPKDKPLWIEVSTSHPQRRHHCPDQIWEWDPDVCKPVIISDQLDYEVSGAWQADPATGEMKRVGVKGVNYEQST